MRDDRQPINEPPIYPGFYPQDEISLVEIFAVLRRRYLLIALIVVFSFIAAAIYLANTQPVYESRALLRVGLIGAIEDVSGGQQIESTPILITRLTEDYGINDAQERPDFPRMESVSLDKSSPDLVELIAQAHSPEQAYDFLQGVTNKLLDEHSQRYDEVKQLLSGKLNYLLRVKRSINQALISLDHQITELTKSDASAAVLLFALEKSRLIEQSLDAEGRITELEIAQDLKLYSSSLLRAPTDARNKVSPKRKLILMMTLVLSLIMGIILAFFIEFVSSNNSDKEDGGLDAKR